MLISLKKSMNGIFDFYELYATKINEFMHLMEWFW